MSLTPLRALRGIWLGPMLAFLLLGAGANYAVARPQAAGQATAPQVELPPSWAAAVYGTDKIGDQMSLPPTRISLMPYRHLELRYALAGYERSKIPLVAFDGAKYFKAGYGDDPGMYYFVPRLAAWLHLPLERTIDQFFGVTLIVSFLVGITGLMLVVSRWPLRLWGAFGLCLLFSFAFRKGDIYLALIVPVVAVVPWLLYLLRKNSAGAVMVIFLIGTGLVAGFANEVRGQAATGLMIIAVIRHAIELNRSWGRKLVLLAALSAGFAIPNGYFHALLSRRDAFLAASQPDYVQTVDRHSIWHALYIGLGYLKDNPYVPGGYRDESAFETVYRISPSTIPLSPEYERILREEIFRMAREHPIFIAATIVGKLRVILFLLICWANVGLFAAVLYPKGWAVESAFWLALAFDSLFGIIAIPQIQYLLGLMAFSTIYGIASLDWALDRHRTGEIHTRLRGLAQRLRFA